jgi:predicted RNase H-like HicB family nuclease
MTRKYSVVRESDPTGCSGCVPELPAVLVTGASADELTTRAAEAKRIYWDVLRAERSPTSELREIGVELPS